MKNFFSDLKRIFETETPLCFLILLLMILCILAMLFGILHYVDSLCTYFLYMRFIV